MTFLFVSCKSSTDEKSEQTEQFKDLKQIKDASVVVNCPLCSVPVSQLDYPNSGPMLKNENLSCKPGLLLKFDVLTSANMITPKTDGGNEANVD